MRVELEFTECQTAELPDTLPRSFVAARVKYVDPDDGLSTVHWGPVLFLPPGVSLEALETMINGSVLPHDHEDDPEDDLRDYLPKEVWDDNDMENG